LLQSNALGPLRIGEYLHQVSVGESVPANVVESEQY
jgi:hypothetical protein